MSLISQYFTLKDSQIHERISLILSISHEVSLEKMTILELFKSLHPFFVSEIEENRIKASKLIKSVFIKAFIIISDELSIILGFFLERIKDIMVIEETVQIISILLEVLSKREDDISFTKESKRFMDIFYNNFIFFLPAYNQKVRSSILKILELIIHKPFIMKESKSQEEFLTHFLNQIEGEKDPRNLLILLNIINVILNSFDRNVLELKKYDIFETLECYYPISFNKPQKNIQISIEKSDLQHALNICLFHDLLYEKSFGIILDKTSSGVLESQIAGVHSILYILIVRLIKS